MTKLGSKSVAEALKKGVEIKFRGEHIRDDLYVCRADWEEAGEARYAYGMRFRCISDRKADFVAEQMMLEELAIVINSKPNQAVQRTSATPPSLT